MQTVQLLLKDMKAVVERRDAVALAVALFKSNFRRNVSQVCSNHHHLGTSKEWGDTSA